MSFHEIPKEIPSKNQRIVSAQKAMCQIIHFSKIWFTTYVSVFTAIQLTTKHDDYPLMEIQAFFKIRSINFVFMSRRERIYWICQITGWGVFGAGNILNVALQGRLVWEIPAS